MISLIWLFIFSLLTGFSAQERDVLLVEKETNPRKSVSAATVQQRPIKYFKETAFWPTLTFCRPDEWVYCKKYNLLEIDSVIKRKTAHRFLKIQLKDTKSVINQSTPRTISVSLRRENSEEDWLNVDVCGDLICIQKE
uniref:Cnidarian restricted protein n=1 Tax=Clytia hemisphaerica TaxID=252671 RepID=A0A7M5WUZ7_9CNID